MTLLLLEVSLFREETQRRKYQIIPSNNPLLVGNRCLLGKVRDIYQEMLIIIRTPAVLSPSLISSLPDEKKNNFPQDFDIDMDDPETEKAAMTIQSQFRKFQKKKHDVKS